MNQDATTTQGIDLPRVRQWLNQRIDGPYPDFTVALISGGRSNLTYTVTSGDGAKWVLRRPPLGQILPTAHDMAREFRILSALQSTPVRVPKLVGLCEDASVTGAPFYVMQHVDGHIIRTGDQAESLLDEASRHRAGVELATARRDPPGRSRRSRARPVGPPGRLRGTPAGPMDAAVRGDPYA